MNATEIKTDLKNQIASIKQAALNDYLRDRRNTSRPAFWRCLFVVAPCKGGFQMGDHWNGYLHRLTDKQVARFIERAREAGAEEISFQVGVEHRANFNDDWSPPEFATVVFRIRCDDCDYPLEWTHQQYASDPDPRMVCRRCEYHDSRNESRLYGDD